MKRLFLISLAFLALTASAQSVQNLYVVQGQDAETALKLADISKITFASGNMNVLLNDGHTDSFALSSVIRLYFSDSSGINPQRTVQASWSPMSAELSLPCAAGTVVSIYNAAGQRVKTVVQTLSLSPFDLSELPRGTYVVEAGNTTIKIVR